MLILIVTAAAVVATVIWYFCEKRVEYKLSNLVLMYWGAAIMWMVDGMFAYRELGSSYFTPAVDDMLNDTFLACSVIVLGMVIWMVSLLISDPKGVRKRLE